MKLRLACSIVALIAFAAVVSYAQNNKQKESELRTVRGTVVDKEEAPVEGAIVYLKNVHSQDIITHLSGEDGTFRFSGLDINVDYEIQGEKNGMTSATHSISNFDTRKEFVLTLKLDRKKSAK
jgi:carboxypeptidase family protein